jgi:hypothetical protein
MPEGELVPGDVNPLAAKIRQVLGVGPYEKVTIVTPEFERTDDKCVTVFPKGKEFLDALKTAPPELLKDIGLGQWDGDLWLFPAEWHGHIPEGYPVVNIFWNTRRFRLQDNQTDRREGLLSFGIRNSRTPHPKKCECPDHLPKRRS